MFELILLEPEIPGNTGNIIRLCATTGCALHLVGPLGFVLDDARLRRAGLDYHEWAQVRQHASLDACLASLGQPRVLALTTRGTVGYADVAYRRGDALLLGPESRGLPAAVLEALPAEQRLRIPMVGGPMLSQSTVGGPRSLNLANAAAVVVYEAWRQLGFKGSVTTPPSCAPGIAARSR